MKIKIFGIILFVIIAFIVSSCNGNGSGNQFDQSGFFDDTSYNVIPPNNLPSGGTGGGGQGDDPDDPDDDDNDDDDDTSKDICGAIKNKSTKIINGVACSSTGSPVMKVLIHTNQNDIYLCSGTLIDSKAVLTAGHCFKDLKYGEFITKVVVVSGGEELDTSEYYVQDNFNVDEGLDVAIVKLKNNVSNIAPVAILTSKIPEAGSTIMTYGYGRDENEASGTLKAAYMKVSHNTPIWLVAGYDTTKTNACYGDSGGPAVVKVEGVAAIAAITSFGTVTLECKDGDYTFFPLLSRSENLSFIKKYASISTM